MNVTQPHRRGRLIPLIHHYCDRWCSSCAFTSRCDVPRALERQLECETVAEAVQQVQASVAQAVKLLREQARRLSVPHGAVDASRPTTTPGVVDLRAARLKRAARTYLIDVARWLRVYKAVRPDVVKRGQRMPDPHNPLDVIDWFASVMGAKVHRALEGCAHGAGRADDIQSDANGSAKIALITIERSRVAWRLLATRGVPEAKSAGTFIVQLDCLAAELARVFPRAQHFVRPGFDAGTRRLAKGPGEGMR